MIFHQEGLSPEQLDLLKQIGDVLFRRDFYLAGGTALASYFCHRRSVDLDWFTSAQIPDPLQFAQWLRDAGFAFTTDQTAPGTLYGWLGSVRTSFLEYRYPLLQPLVTWAEMGCRLASLDDLGCMKLSAIAQRGSKKDFIDMHALITHHRSLAELLSLYRQKFSVTDIGPVLYGLAYFDDADKEPDPAMLWDLKWRDVKEDITRWLKKIVRRIA